MGGNAHRNLRAEPATEKCKMYLFSFPILLGRSWTSVGDEINFLKWQGLAFSQISPNRSSCFHCRDIQTWPGHLMPMGHFSFSCAWYLRSQYKYCLGCDITTWKYHITPSCRGERAASCWILCSRIPASSVICWGPHWGRAVFRLLISGPDLCVSSGCAMRTEFKSDCIQRHPFHLLRKSFYLILNMYVLHHPRISCCSGIGVGRCCCLCLFSLSFV